LVVNADVGIYAKRQANIAVPGERLGHLGREASSFETGDEKVPVAVEVGVLAIAVLVLQKI
jgi:hypothetical protein